MTAMWRFVGVTPRAGGVSKSERLLLICLRHTLTLRCHLVLLVVCLMG